MLTTCPGLSTFVWARSFTSWSGQDPWAQIPGCGEGVGDEDKSFQLYEAMIYGDRLSMDDTVRKLLVQ
jgi:hypothetical protein